MPKNVSLALLASKEERVSKQLGIITGSTQTLIVPFAELQRWLFSSAVAKIIIIIIKKEAKNVVLTGVLLLLEQFDCCMRLSVTDRQRKLRCFLTINDFPHILVLLSLRGLSKA